jgi:hypothetical protein
MTNPPPVIVPDPPPSPPAPDPNTVNLVKMIGGYFVSLACLAMVAFNQKWSIGLTSEMSVILIGVAIGGGVLGGHGALKTPTGGGA